MSFLKRKAERFEVRNSGGSVRKRRFILRGSIVIILLLLLLYASLINPSVGKNIVTGASVVLADGEDLVDETVEMPGEWIENVREEGSDFLDVGERNNYSFDDFSLSVEKSSTVICVDGRCDDLEEYIGVCEQLRSAD